MTPGKTGMDAVRYLQQFRGIPVEDIHWIAPRNYWFMSRIEDKQKARKAPKSGILPWVEERAKM